MSASVPSSGQARPVAHDRLEELASQVTQAFIAAQLKAVDSAGVMEESLFEEEGTLSSSLELFAVVSRLKYEDNCTFILNVFDNLASEYQQTFAVVKFG
ncbi:hypothetical protein HK097_003511 [Rhizophlyctis rosea]|uniref:Exportin-7/Ran-binding protein 17 TPR repeats domain-containing protein n=1 Tax=Rhizophlyctis rosea TaxID=64517 RepID=A0AAD5X670_9FUNG|nr:hypothetical protein HK097_003511 [Rhizophlyctis rosea]